MSLTLLAAATSPRALWYLTRGTGLVALILLSATVVLGVLNVSRWSTPGWPRFAISRIHRNVSLLVVVVVAIHIVTAELDTFAPVGWLAVVIPFASSYRPIWLGLGTVAFDLLLAMVVTSLLRERIGYRAWRAVHWAAYVSWPVAVVHGLGTGTDPRVHWVLLLTVVCVLAVAVAVGWRLVHDWPAHPVAHLGATVVALAGTLVVAVWAAAGPLKPGWAREAGTPSTLLASGNGATSAPASPSTTPASGGTAPATTAPAGVPAAPFSASLSGQVIQQGPDASGQVTVRISTRVSGGMDGTLDVVLIGQSAGGGVSLESSDVTLGTAASPAAYRGSVIDLSGEQLLADVRSTAGVRLTLDVSLTIDPSSGSLTGTMEAQTGRRFGDEGGR